jgi:hypothetical protein
MRIRNIRVERCGDGLRVAANVAWEDRERREREIYFETDAAFAGALCADAAPFLLGAFVPAMRAGERRIAIEGSLCPRLREGVMTAMDTLRRWYGPPRSTPRLESSKRDAVLRPVTPPRAALFLSGGVDSLFLLRMNRRYFPPDHPGSFRDGIYVWGADMDGTTTEHWEAYRAGRAAIAPVAEEMGLELIPIHTNVKRLDHEMSTYIFESMGSTLAAVGHALVGRLSDVSIAATHCIADLRPHGSHPHLVQAYTSSGLRLHHEDQRHPRLAKVAELAHWDTALANLRVCFDYEQQHDGINCGRCHKCIRTMLELTAAGADPGKLKTLALASLSPQMVRRMPLGGWNQSVYLPVLLEPLRGVGRSDLADALTARLRRNRWERRLKRLLIRRNQEAARNPVAGQRRRDECAIVSAGREREP